MRKVLLTLLVLFSLSGVAYAQERTHVTTGANLPSSCTVGDLFHKTGSSNGFYGCTTTDTWVKIDQISASETLINKVISGAANTISNIAFSSLSTASALSVLGNGTNATAVVTPIAATNDGEVLRRSGTTVAFGTVATAGIADNAVTLAKLATQATLTLLVNLTGGAAVPTASTLTATLDAIMGTTQGAVLTRNASAWVKLDPGASGTFLKSNGAAADIAWATPAGAGDVSSNTSTSVANEMVLFTDTTGKSIKRSALTGIVLSTSGVASAYAGTTCTNQFVRSLNGSAVATCATVDTNDIAANAVTLAKLATQSAGTVLANVTGGAAVPTAATPTAVLDVIGSTRGQILYRNATVWTPLATGTAGQALTTGGVGADPSWATVSTASSSDTFTNKTIDAEGTGNTITVPSMINFVGAVCQNATASLGFSSPVSNPAVAACVTGTNTQFGVAQFADGSNLSVQGHFTLPSDWTGNIDLAGKWRSAGTTGSVVWQVATVCVADAETSDPSFNTASTATDATKGTTLQQNNFSITSITVTGCAAGEELFFKLFRDSAHGSDDLASTAELISFTFTIRRAM